MAKKQNNQHWIFDKAGNKRSVVPPVTVKAGKIVPAPFPVGTFIGTNMSGVNFNR